MPSGPSPGPGGHPGWPTPMTARTAGLTAPHRPQWRSRWGFLLAATGSAIGLGSLWRFASVCYENGGGAYLIPYLVALLTAGIPLMIPEYGIGHRMRGSAPMSFAAISPAWEWLDGSAGT